MLLESTCAGAVCTGWLELVGSVNDDEATPTALVAGKLTVIGSAGCTGSCKMKTYGSLMLGIWISGKMA